MKTKSDLIKVLLLNGFIEVFPEKKYYKSNSHMEITVLCEDKEINMYIGELPYEEGSTTMELKY